MKENTLVLWLVISKKNKMLLFSDEPQRSDTCYGWTGTLYINSVMYSQLEQMVKQSEMTYSSEPEMLTFTIKS